MVLCYSVKELILGFSLILLRDKEAVLVFVVGKLFFALMGNLLIPSPTLSDCPEILFQIKYVIPIREHLSIHCLMYSMINNVHH